MKENSRIVCVNLCLLIIVLAAVTASAATYTATNNAGWNTAGTWDPNGIPGSADTAIIPVGKTVTLGSTPGAVGVVQIQGTLSLSSSNLFGDVFIDTTGTWLPTGSGVSANFGGNVTNNGVMSIASLGSGTAYTYSGTGKTLFGNISNVVAIFTGSYQNLGTFVTALKGTQDALKGAGSFTNIGTLFFFGGSGGSQNTTPSIAVLDCSSPGNFMVWTNFNGNPTLHTNTYYDLIVGQTGSSAWNLLGGTINHNFTLNGSGPISLWPAGNTVGGKFTYSSGSGTASTLPAAFSVPAFAQTAGKITIPAGGVLTVTGTGAGIWSQTGGNLSAGTGGTVKFTGMAPDIGGATIINLLLDATATGATASTAFFVTNALTISSGASLDVTALPGSTYTMLGTESNFNSGTIKGSLATVSGSKVYAGTDGGYATGAITGDLSMAAGSTVNLDVNSTASGANDLLVVGGALTLNNNTFNLKAPSAGASIDTANDYTLVTATSISGTPVLHWVTAPASSTNYTLVVSSTNIKLHYSASGPPSLSAPRINSIIRGVGQITCSGTNGTPSGSYAVIVSANPSAALSTWTTNQTGAFDSGGNFSFTVSTTNSQQVISVKQP